MASSQPEVAQAERRAERMEGTVLEVTIRDWRGARRVGGRGAGRGVGMRMGVGVLVGWGGMVVVNGVDRDGEDGGGGCCCSERMVVVWCSWLCCYVCRMPRPSLLSEVVFERLLRQ